MISQFSKIHGAVICSDLGTKIKLEHLANVGNGFVISVNKCVTTSVTNIKMEEALRLTLNKSFAFFDISCRNNPTASQRKIMKIISVRYFTAIFKKPFTKLIEFFRLLILKSFKNLQIFLFQHIFHQNRKYFRTTLRLESTFIARASSIFLKLMIHCQSYTKVLYDIYLLR